MVSQRSSHPKSQHGHVDCHAFQDSASSDPPLPQAGRSRGGGIASLVCVLFTHVLVHNICRWNLEYPVMLLRLANQCIGVSAAEAAEEYFLGSGIALCLTCACFPFGAGFGAALAAGFVMGLGFLFFGTQMSSTIFLVKKKLALKHMAKAPNPTTCFGTSPPPLV